MRNPSAPPLTLSPLSKGRGNAPPKCGVSCGLVSMQPAMNRRKMLRWLAVGLPAPQAAVARFESLVRSAKAAGASILRTVSLGGRRYEAIDTADGWREFLERAWKSLVLAEPVVRKHRLRLAIENHKDWRAPELLEVLKRLGSGQVGVCVDTGNSIALLEDPLAVVEAYAPHAFTSHLKDMGVQEYQDGFLLSEVPLGDGFLDLPKMIATLRRAQPQIHFNLEMITRDPLK